MKGWPAWLRESTSAAPALIALDTMCFIYQFERRTPFAAATRALFEGVERRSLTASASVLVLTEVLTLPLREQDDALATRYRALLSTFPNLSLKPVDDAVAARGAELRARYGLRTPDALHLASAQLAGARAFVTADSRLAAVREIEVLMLPAT